MDEPQRELPTAALSALNEGNMIEAIKIVREARASGLKEAKDEVDAYLVTNPVLRARFKSARTEVNRSGLFWLIVSVIAAVVVFLYVRGP
jgi:ribosomal protein L7/L12